MYTLDNSSGSNHISRVDLLFAGYGVYKYVYEKEKSNNVVQSTTTSIDIDKSPSTTLILPGNSHYIHGKRVVIKTGSVNKVLLTCKNLTNYVDILPSTLFRHVENTKADIKMIVRVRIQLKRTITFLGIINQTIVTLRVPFLYEKGDTNLA